MDGGEYERLRDFEGKGSGDWEGAEDLSKLFCFVCIKQWVYEWGAVGVSLRRRFFWIDSIEPFISVE